MRGGNAFETYTQLREELKKVDERILERKKLIREAEEGATQDPARIREVNTMFDKAQKEFQAKSSHNQGRQAELNRLREERAAKEKQLNSLRQNYEENRLYEKSEDELQRELKEATDEFNSLRSKMIEKENLISVSVEQEFRERYQKIYFKMVMDQAKTRLDTPEIKALYDQLLPYYRNEGFE